MNILSLQSWVCYGHVGNAAAMFPLQRLGAEVWAVNTVQFSNHTGYGHWTGQVFSAAHIAALVDGIAARGVLPGCDATLSGYMGDPATGAAILRAVRDVRAANPAALYCCDPVIGDTDTGVYVRPGITELLRDQAVPEADLLTPNQFELALLTGLPCATLAGACAAMRALRGRMRPGPRAIMVTSLRVEDTPDDALDVLIGDAAGTAHRLRVPLIPRSYSGGGDAIAALFLWHCLQGRGAVAAAELAVASIHGVLSHSFATKSGELQLIAAQEEFVAPSRHFQAERCVF
jgi:pyridoxine kinase